MYTLHFYQLLLFFRYPRKFRVVVVVVFFLFFNRERHCKKLSIRIVRLLHMLCFSIRDLTVSIAQTRTGTCPSGSTGTKGGKP